jgi:hypothetical protein
MASTTCCHPAMPFLSVAIDPGAAPSSLPASALLGQRGRCRDGAPHAEVRASARTSPGRTATRALCRRRHAQTHLPPEAFEVASRPRLVEHRHVFYPPGRRWRDRVSAGRPVVTPPCRCDKVASHGSPKRQRGSVSRFRQNATATHPGTSSTNYCLPAPALCTAHCLSREERHRRRRSESFSATPRPSIVSPASASFTARGRAGR